jgi:hypothetical protein
MQYIKFVITILLIQKTNIRLAYWIILDTF